MLIEIDAPGHEDNDAAPAAPAQEQTPAQPAAVPNNRSSWRIFQFKLPDIGEGIAEGEIVKWFVKRATQLMKMIHY